MGLPTTSPTRSNCFPICFDVVKLLMCIRDRLIWCLPLLQLSGPFANVTHGKITGAGRMKPGQFGLLGSQPRGNSNPKSNNFDFSASFRPQGHERRLNGAKVPHWSLRHAPGTQQKPARPALPAQLLGKRFLRLAKSIAEREFVASSHSTGCLGINGVS